MLFELLLAIIVFFVTFQISLVDFRLFTGKYNYRLRLSNYISLLGGLSVLYVIWRDSQITSFSTLLTVTCATLFASFLEVWILAKMNRSQVFLTFLYIGFMLIGSYITLYSVGLSLLSPFAIMALYYRNNPFSLVHKNNLLLIDNRKKKATDKVIPLQELNKSALVKEINALYNFSNVGYQSTSGEQVKYNVVEYGIHPNTKEDLLGKLQQLIDRIGKNGGGIIYFPKGKYLFNKEIENRKFLQINYSNITLEGELDTNGNPVAELVNCNHTLKGKKNPWLSPFFITTGEKLQPSNIFFGLQFKKKKNIITKSGSLADPGSDGTILTPTYISNITQDCLKGEILLHVEDTQKLKDVKYIMLGMYNTSLDGNLIKEILNCESLREEWGTALRAGEEEAPSFQWLIEIDKIINSTTIKLKQPLIRDIKIIYSPAIFEVPMLEHIRIKNLKISSKWNGLFRHHGFRRYYSMIQTQEMDYGWNGVNLKRAAHSHIENVIFENFSNPLYIVDSRNTTTEKVTFQGYDGHQGIKLYEHACDNLIQDIEFKCNFADMMGGEGNAYGNVFSNILYSNPYYNPVDFDFHGFSEGPMSPPAYNLFENVKGFRHIKAGGALYNQPACAQHNIWWNFISEGERKNDSLFLSLNYIPKTFSIKKLVRIILICMITLIKGKGIAEIKRLYELKIIVPNKHRIPYSEHHLLFPNSIISGLITKMRTSDFANYKHENIKGLTYPYSLYKYQKENRK